MCYRCMTAASVTVSALIAQGITDSSLKYHIEFQRRTV